MARKASSLLLALERLRLDFGEGSLSRKRSLLGALERRPLSTADEVSRLHDSLCFLRAWPDGPALRVQADRMLQGFSSRRDLRKHRGRLAGSGIAGTEMRFRFFGATASWLAGRWGDLLWIDWPAFENAEKLEELLTHLSHYAETPGLDGCGLSAREWIARMKGSEEGDAAFLIRRFGALRVDPALREKIYDDLDPPLRLLPGPDTPSCTCEKFPARRIAYQTGPLAGRPADLRREIGSVRPRFQELSGRRARRLVDLARGTMAARQRDLDAFAYADPRDVRLVDCGGGVAVALLGVVPERRFLLEALYGFLVLKNGVPVGYGTGTALFSSCEVTYNIFPAFRGGEAAPLYGRVLAVFRRLFLADTFAVDPYQLGRDNEEALASGAWWFYRLLGFAPRDPAALRLARREEGRRRKKPAFRTPATALVRLAEAPLFLSLKKEREDVLGLLDLGGVGLKATDYLVRRFGSRREEGARVCAMEAASLLGVRSPGKLPPGERLAFGRWAPLVLALGSLPRWPREARRSLARVILAKGGRRESDYLLRFDRHQRLRRALRKASAKD